LAEAFGSAAERVDVILSLGGVSGSEADEVAAAISETGGLSEHFQLALKPGKPLLAGRIGNVPVLSLPGNPVSALINVHLFARPLVAARCGLQSCRPRGQASIVAAPIPHVRGRSEFAPGHIVGQDEDGRLLVRKALPSGSARLRAMVIADGFLEIPSAMDDLSAGAPVTFHPAAAFA
jgi:molybdopterin molybdotransferase